ncbi:MAG: hypothetical protein ACOYYS_13415 [Chloroflexota bacterium]
MTVTQISSSAARHLSTVTIQGQSLPPSISPTHTPFVTRTPTTTLSSYPRLSTNTFDVSRMITRTPSSPAQCPVENSKISLDETAFSSDKLYADIAPAVLEYLNAGGSTQVLVDYFESLPQWWNGKRSYKGDLTGDTVPEMITSSDHFFYIFGCHRGKYEILLSFDPYDHPTVIHTIADMNLDGVSEVVVYSIGCLGDKCSWTNVYGWNGAEFLSLFSKDADFDTSCSNMPTPFNVTVEDVDQNGTLEVILNGGIPWWGEGILWRGETRICMWNRHVFSLYKTLFSTPQYRFQAVQDGDRAALAGDYEQELNFYQQVIFNDELDFWSPERRVYEYGLLTAHYADPTSIPLPFPTPDPNEYPHLAAYAYYRMMLLHVIMGNSLEAQKTYETFIDAFAIDTPGYTYVEIGVAFWNEYKISQNIERSCSRAISIATANTEILSYLGGPGHGAQSIFYKPEHICPFE